jgi:biopolymer transport protein ExbB
MILPLIVALVSAACAIGCLTLSLHIRTLRSCPDEREVRQAATAPPKSRRTGEFSLALSQILRSLAALTAAYAVARLGAYFADHSNSGAWTAIVLKVAWIALAIEFTWTGHVIIERLLAYRAEQRAFEAFAPTLADALQAGRLDEAVRIAERHKDSHLAQIVTAGLMEFRTSQMNSISDAEIEASKRAIGRAEAVARTELKRGLSSLAWIGSTAPFVGLLGTVVGIIHGFRNISSANSVGLGALAGAVSEALVTSAAGLIVAIPAVWMFNYLTARTNTFDEELGKGSAELIAYLDTRAGQRQP